MNKKKIFIRISIAVGIFVLIIVARYLNWYTFYSLPTTNMDPAYKAGKYILGSSLFSAKRGDIVAYSAKALPHEQQSYIALCRLVADEGDTLEIRRGFAYINSKLMDDTMNLGMMFKIKNQDFDFTPTEYHEKHKIFTFDSITMLNFSYNEIREYNLTDKSLRVIDTSSTYITPEIFGANPDANWSLDNFGPVVIPKNMVFLLGDNRSNSIDSRARGFTPRNKIVAKVLN